MATAGKDLETYATADGWFISLLAAVETEILNLMQMTNVNLEVFFKGNCVQEPASGL